MNYSWKDRLRNYAWLQRALAFLITVFVIFLFLPKEKLFQYEYQAGEPWKHDKLLAPFDFGIRKTTEELNTEREEAVASQPLVFIQYDHLTEQSLLDYDHVLGLAIGRTDSVHRCDSVFNASTNLMGALLDRGLIERNHEVAVGLKPFDHIFIFQDGQLIKKELRQMLSIQQVMDSLSQFISVVDDSICGPIMASCIQKGLRPNALYDDSLTQRLLQAELDKIVAVEGKIYQQTAIIDKGDIVTDEKFKILESLKAEYEERTISSTSFEWSLLGEMGIAIILLGLLMLFIYMNQNRVFNDPRPITLALSLTSISFVMCALAFSSKEISVYVIPIGIAPLLLRMFYDFRISIFAFLIVVLLIALFSSNPLEFTVIQLSAISFATLYQASSTKRSRMLGTALLVFIGYSVIYTFISLAQSGSWNSIDTAYYGWFAINGLLCTLVFPLIYVVEKIFGYISETTLLELSESNQPLLRELAIKAPGTFQHSLQVANLCEKVAAKIGGNTVLLRTAAMYHDVGKMNEPQFFIENQLPDNNPHDDLEPEESAAIIISHVTRGVELARQHKLPMDIIQFIQTHHGTSRVRFFLKRAKEKAEMTGEEVNEDDYKYPGPRPKTKEQAILMMADSVEAASRSLKKYDHQSLEELVERLIDQQRQEGQFEEAPITLKDISDVKIALQSALKGIFHQRISYD